jgi:hypothetical protein
LVVIASKSRLLAFSHPPPGTIAELPAHHAAYLMFNCSMKFGRYRGPRFDPGLSLGYLPKRNYGWYYRQSNYNPQIQSQNRISPRILACKDLQRLLSIADANQSGTPCLLAPPMLLC